MMKIINENLDDEFKDYNISFETVLEHLIINKMHIKFPFYVIYSECKGINKIEPDWENTGYVSSLYEHNNGIENEYFISVETSGKFNKPISHEETLQFYNNLQKIKIFGPRKLSKAKEFVQRCNEYAGLSECELRKITKVEDLYL